MDRAQIKETVKSQLKGKCGTLFLIMLIINLIAIGVSFLNIIPFIGTILVFAYNIIVPPCFMMSQYMIWLDIAKGNTPDVSDFKKGFNIFGGSLGLLWLTALIVVLAVIVPIILIAIVTVLLPVLGIVLTIAFSLALIVFSFIFSYRISAAWFVMYENPGKSAMFALKESAKLTKGHVFDLFVLDLSFIGWNMLNGLTLGILGMAWLNHYHMATFAHYYLTYKNKMYPPAPVEIEDPNTNIIDEEFPLPPPPQGILLGEKGSCAGYKFDLTPGEEFIIGKDAKVCSIVIDPAYKEVSRKHVGVVYDATRDVYRVTDYSANGTWIDGVKLTNGVPQYAPHGSLMKLANDKTIFLLG